MFGVPGRDGHSMGKSRGARAIDPTLNITLTKVEDVIVSTLVKQSSRVGSTIVNPKLQHTGVGPRGHPLRFERFLLVSRTQVVMKHHKMLKYSRDRHEMRSPNVIRHPR